MKRYDKISCFNSRKRNVRQGKCEVTKVDKDSQKVLEGVVFEVQDEQGKVVPEVQTDKNGKAKISDLSVGKYKLVEKESTRLQTINRTSIIRDQKGMTKVLSLKVENELLDKGSVEITKVERKWRSISGRNIRSAR